MLGAASLVPNGNLILMQRGIDYGSSQAWHRELVFVASGFTTSFDFSIKNNNGASQGNRAQGFAFVFQGYGNKVRGDSASGLGYNGIQESLAIGLALFGVFFFWLFLCLLFVVFQNLIPT